MKKSVVLILLIALASGCARDEKPAQSTSTAPRPAAPAAQNTGTHVGATFPDYTAVMLDGSRFDLGEWRGKVVLLNLWATWCGPCRYEIPELQTLHDQHRQQGFEVIGVSVDESGIESVREFVDEYRMTYPVVLDPDGNLANLMETSVLPTSVLLDRTGVIVWRKIGAVMQNDEELARAIEAAL